jgi:hypothetical protein
MKQCAELGARKIVRGWGRVTCKRARAAGKGMTLLRWTGGALSGRVSKLSIDCVRAIYAAFVDAMVDQDSSSLGVCG